MKVGRVGGGVAAPKDPGELSTAEQDAILKLVANEKKSAKKGDTAPIAAKYVVVRPDIVAKYMVVPPWGGIDAHQSIINKVTKDGKVTKTEALLIRKLFNRDIKEASRDGQDIRADVRAFLTKALKGMKMDKTAKALIFGKGGPAAEPPVVAKYVVPAPKYMVPGPIYILPMKPN